jgi:CRISPR-associated protein Csx17
VTTLALTGCRPEPIGSYLKSLGVLRLVAAQVDPSATGRWEGDTFRLDSTLDAADLVHFLTQEYRPTPVLSPWNSDSGFKEAGSKATVALLAVEASADPRFGDYQNAIAVVRHVLQSPGWATRSKSEQTTLLRNRLPDVALEWLDAAVVLRPESPAFPALLGTGGNFGRLELSPTFISRLLQVLETAPRAQARSRDWLRAALFDEGTPVLRSDPVGQFEPGSAGGLRGDVLSGKPLTNPWDFVLLIEGSLIWASGVSRRLGGATSVAAMPFTVAPSPVGQGSLTRGERAKAELWAPLWPEPLGLPALRRLFSEGRISWSEGQAKTGLDVVRAVHTLGVDAGISEFVRHVVAERMGQSPLAVPVGRFKVGSDPRVAVSASLDPWVDRLRHAAALPSAPSSLVRSAVRVDRALFVAASGRSSAFQDLLIATSKAEVLCGRTERSRTDGSVPPLPWLSPRDWLPALDDGTPEFRLAASLALARDEHVSGNRMATVRSLVRPIEIAASGKDPMGRVRWSREEAPILGLGVRSVHSVLANVLVERSEEARNRDGDAPERREGIAPWFPAACSAGQGDTEALASGVVDLHRFSDLVEALLLLRPDSQMTYRWTAISSSAGIFSPAWRILAPFYAQPGSRPAEAASLRPEASWARGLIAGAVEPVLTEALLRWRQARLLPVYTGRSVPVIARGVDGIFLAAALLCAAPRRDIDAAFNSVIDPESQILSKGDAS